MLIKEIQTLKSNSKRPTEDEFTPLQPRIMNFSSAGSSDVHQGDFIPMQTQNTVAGPSQAVRVSTIRDLGSIPESSAR